MALESYETFDAVKSRLDEIVDAVSDESLPLDDALALYEEAVALGLRASDLLETDIEAERARDEAEQAASAVAAEGARDGEAAAGTTAADGATAPDAAAPGRA